MIVETLSKPARRALAVGVLAVLAIGVLSATVLPVWLVNADLQSQVDDLSDRLVRYENIAAQDRQLQRHYTQLTRVRASSGQLLKSATESVAAAEIQRALGTIAKQNSAEVMSTQILPAAELDEEGLKPVGLRVRVRGTLPDLVKTIYDVEASSMLLFVEDFSMRFSSDRRARGTEETIRYFEASFDVVGFMAELI